MQDLLDHGEGRKKQEEAEFARIDAEVKDERDKEMGFRGKVCPLDITESRMRVTNIPRRFLMSWMAQIPSLPGQSQRLSLVSRIG